MADLKALERPLISSGLDLVRAFDASRYNERIARHSRLAPLPLFGRERALGILVGNTRALWPRFVAACRENPELLADSHPLDRYVTEVVRAAAGLLPARTEVRFSHEGGPRLVSMLDLAAASGLAHVGPAHLAVHPAHGTWIGLRAVIVADRESPESPPASPSPCEGCAAPCKEALDRALAVGASRTRPDVEGEWLRWVAVRDACPVGRSSRYGEAQLRYHYTKDRGALLREL